MVAHILLYHLDLCNELIKAHNVTTVCENDNFELDQPMEFFNRILY